MNFNTDSGDESRAVLDSIRRIVRALRVASRATERELGLSGAQLFVLQKLDEESGLSLGELARRTLTHQSSVSVVVGRLVEQGYIERRTSPDDARKVELLLTARGRARVRKAPEPLQKRLVTAVESLPRADRARLAALLTAVVDKAGLGGEPAPLFFEEEHR